MHRNNLSPIYSESFADTQLLRFELKGFEYLNLRQKQLIFCLAKAALAGRDIITDQHGAKNLIIRKVLEVVYKNYNQDKTSKEYLALETYLKQVWFANGIHHHSTYRKFTPFFPPEFLRGQILQNEDELCSCLNLSSIETLMEAIFPLIFDKNVSPRLVDKSPNGDMALQSTVNYYVNVNQQEVEDFYCLHRNHEESAHPISIGLNSRLVKSEHGITEEVWKIGGLYTSAIAQIVVWLEKALAYAENEKQQNVIRLLIEYYKTGNLQLFDDYSIAWVEEMEGKVDFINGFIEVYTDPFGLKGAWEGLVHYIDEEATYRTEIISNEAQWFEDHSPVDSQFKKECVRGVSARVVNAAMLGGDEYPATAIGINLPNSDWIRAEHGSKSITLSNITQAYDEASLGNGFYEEFVVDKPTLQHIKKYDSLCNDLHTDLHECLGHGSGKLLPGVSGTALKAYADTIEEARADLFALYYLADNHLIDLGVMTDGEAYKAHYYTYLMNGVLTQLARIEEGQQIEEAHMRNRAVVSRWVLHHYPAAAHLQKCDDGKTYLLVNNYQMLREAFATLLSEVQRIKSEGDYQSAKSLVETYGIQIDPDLHAEIRKRYAALNIKPYKGFLNPWLKPVLNEQNEIIDIVPDYTETFAQQMLRYSSEYGFL